MRLTDPPPPENNVAQKPYMKGERRTVAGKMDSLNSSTSIVLGSSGGSAI